MEDIRDNLIKLAKSSREVVGLVKGADKLPTFTFVCVDRRKEQFEGNMPTAAKELGQLCAMRVRKDGKISLLYGEPPNFIKINTIGASNFLGIKEGDEILFEWDMSLSLAKVTEPTANVAAMLNKCESDLWIMQYEICKNIEMGDLLAAVEILSALRNILKRLALITVKETTGIEKVSAECDKTSLLNAVSAASELYFSIRYSYAGEEFIRNEEAEFLATSALERLRDG